MASDQSAKEESLEYLFDFAEEHSDSTEGESSPLHQSLKDITDRYCEPEVIGKGGMKTITKFFDETTGRYVAMATLHNDAPAELYEPFLREARLTALLDHPNIISIFDIGLNDTSAPYFTMELKTGQDLADVIEEIHSKRDNGTLALNDINRMLEIFLKICDGMAYAHSQNVLHLDIKPENIQVGLYGEVIICDWGLGKVLGNTDYDGGDFDRMLLNPDLLNNMTRFSTIRGTPGFMAPEQIHGETDKNTRTDIYSLGALLYTMLTNTLHVKTDSGLDKALDDTLDGKITPPDKLNPQCGVPASLSSVAMKALALEPNDRYIAVELLRDDVYKFMTGYSTSAENAGFIKEFGLFFKRNRVVCLTALLSLIIVTLLTGVFVSGLNQSRLVAESARQKAEENQLLATQQKERAERVLELYELEKKKGTEFVEEHFASLQHEVYRLTDTQIFEDPEYWLEKALHYLDLMIDSDSTDPWPYMQRGYIYFLMQELEKANTNFERHSETAERLHVISQKYESKAVPGKPLEIETLLSLLTDLNERFNRPPQALIIMYYDPVKRKSLSEHSQVVKRVLQIYNRRWESGDFVFDETNHSLKLSGKHLSSLTAQGKNLGLKMRPKKTQIPLLHTLKLRKLNLQGTEIFDINQLAGLPILDLDIRNTLINHCGHIKTPLPKLRRLIVSPGQLIPDDPVWTQKWLKVIVKE